MRWKPTRRRDLSARRFARRGPGWRRPQAIDWTFPSSLSTGRRRALSMSSPAARPPSVSNAHRPARRWWATVPTPRTWLAAAPSPARGELSRCRDDLPAFDERHAGGRPRAPDGGWPRCTIRQARPGGDGPVPVGLEVARSYPCRRQAGEEPLLAYARDPHKRVERRTQHAVRPGGVGRGPAGRGRSSTASGWSGRSRPGPSRPVVVSPTCRPGCASVQNALVSISLRPECNQRLEGSVRRPCAGQAWTTRSARRRAASMRSAFRWSTSSTHWRA
jgi:hypothetical protein